MKRHADAGDDVNEHEKVSKNTLESDEELDEDEKGGRMNETELQVGQEPETIVHDGDINITPFNMREELEDDGHFDASGTFIFKKTNEVGDNWLEDVDWSEVRHREDKKESAPVNIEAINEALPEITDDQQTKLYHEVCGLLQPKETVLKALKRMGPNRVGVTRHNWTRRRGGSVSKKNDPTPESGNPIGFAKLTELANDLLGSGDFDIYQKTLEVIEDLVSSRTKRKEDCELDALGASFDDGSVVESCEQNENASDLKWIMKKGGVDADAPIEGPFSEEDLKRWISQKIFSRPQQVFVKRQGTSEAFQPLTSIKF